MFIGIGPLGSAWRRGRAAGAAAIRLGEQHPIAVLLVVLALGVLVRLPFLGSRGFPVDVHDFQAWALRLAEVGPGNFYQPDYFADFLPGYLWWLWLVGSWATAFHLPTDSFGFLLLLKLPPLAASVAAGAVLYAWAAPRLGTRAAHAAAALYLINPAVIFAGPLWGQVDELAAALIFAGTVALLRGRPEWAAPLGVAAVLTKPQVAVLGPIWIAVVIIPYLPFLRTAVADRLPRLPVRRLALAGLLGLALAVLLLAPFGLGPARLLQHLTTATSVYPYTSVGALNLWSLPGSAPWQSDQVRWGPLTLLVWGMFLFVATGVIALAALVRRPTAGMALAVSAVVLLAFFVLPTRIHERYLIPALVFLAALAVLRARWLVLYAVVTGLLYLNLLRVYTTPLYETGMHRPLLASSILEPPGMWLIGLGFVLSLAVLLYAVVLEPAAVASTSPVGVQSPVAPSAAPAPALPPVTLRWSRREWLVLAVLLLLVFGLRFLRLADPVAPVFDEVYHPRTAMEYLAYLRYGVRDEIYEWTHPPLAKELMAAGIALWGNHRVTHRWTEPIGADLMVADPVRHRLYWGTPDGSLVVADARSGSVVDRHSLPSPPAGLAVSPGGDLGVALADGSVLVGPAGGPPRPFARLEQPAAQLLATRDAWWALGADGLRIYQRREGTSWLPIARLGARATAMTVTDTGEIWVAESNGVTVWDQSGKLVQRVSEAPVRFLAFNANPVENETRVIAAGDRFVDLYSAPRHSLVRRVAIPPLASVPTPLVINGHAHLLHVSTTEGVRVIDLIGNSPFTQVAAPEGTLALDADASRPDSRNQVYLWDARARTLAQIDGGHNAFGWRLPGVLFAVLLTLGIYLLARALLRSVLAAQIATFLAAFDFMTFSQSRIGTPDVYVAALVVLAYWAAYRALHARGRRQVAWFAGAGLALGAACASKWVGVYAAGALLAGLATWAWLRPALRPRPLQFVALVALTLVGLPLIVYLASYALYFRSGHSFANFLALQQSMYHYHATLKDPHPAASPWWSWPLVLKPVWFYAHTVQTDRGPATAVIYDAGNLALWWPMLPALIGLSVMAWRRRVVGWALPGWASLGQWLPWVRITRVAYIYHFFSVVPFGVVALTYWVERGLRARTWRRWAAAYLVLVVVLFVLIYPWISAVPIRDQDLANYQWLASWAYDFQFYPSKSP